MHDQRQQQQEPHCFCSSIICREEVSFVTCRSFRIVTATTARCPCYFSPYIVDRTCAGVLPLGLHRLSLYQAYWREGSTRPPFTTDHGKDKDSRKIGAGGTWIGYPTPPYFGEAGAHCTAKLRAAQTCNTTDKRKESQYLRAIDSSGDRGIKRLDFARVQRSAESVVPARGISDRTSRVTVEGPAEQHFSSAVLSAGDWFCSG